ADRDGEDRGEREDADPERLGADVLEVLALRDGERLVRHQRAPPAAASFAFAVSTVRTKISCSDGSRTSKRRTRTLSTRARSTCCGSLPFWRNSSAYLPESLTRWTPGRPCSALPSPS